MLYVGLGLVCVGLVITVVGLGDKGFQTLQGDNSYIYINNSYIHLINPILVCVGLVIHKCVGSWGQGLPNTTRRQLYCIGHYSVHTVRKSPVSLSPYL